MDVGPPLPLGTPWVWLGSSVQCMDDAFVREYAKQLRRTGCAYAIVAISSGEPHGMECESWMVSRTRPPSRL